MLDLGPTAPLSVLPLRFWSKVYVAKNGCWLWQSHLNHLGYAYYWHLGKSRSAHRLAYESLVVHIPSDKESDHLCHQRSCINPFHLEIVTHQVNASRGLNGAKTHCKNGHSLSGSNLRLIERRGGKERVCRTCYTYPIVASLGPGVGTDKSFNSFGLPAGTRVYRCIVYVRYSSSDILGAVCRGTEALGGGSRCTSLCLQVSQWNKSNIYVLLQ